MYRGKVRPTPMGANRDAYQSCVMDTAWAPTNPILPVTPQFLPQKKHDFGASQIGFQPQNKNGTNDLFSFCFYGQKHQNLRHNDTALAVNRRVWTAGTQFLDEKTVYSTFHM